MINTPSVTTEHKQLKPNSPCQNEKKQEYLERYRFWSAQSIQQLSFSNNLLLTIAVAALGYFFGKREKVYSNLFIDLNESIDLVIFFFILGSFLLALSILCGVVLSISRLYDFRLTRHISLTRKRVCQKGDLLQDEPLNSPSMRSAFHDIWHIFYNFEKFEISQQECREAKETLLHKFRELRKISQSLGRITWVLFNFQSVFFVVGILIYAVVIIIM